MTQRLRGLPLRLRDNVVRYLVKIVLQLLILSPVLCLTRERYTSYTSSTWPSGWFQKVDFVCNEKSSFDKGPWSIWYVVCLSYLSLPAEKYRNLKHVFGDIHKGRPAKIRMFKHPSPVWPVRNMEFHYTPPPPRKLDVLYGWPERFYRLTWTGNRKPKIPSAPTHKQSQNFIGPQAVSKNFPDFLKLHRQHSVVTRHLLDNRHNPDILITWPKCN